MIVSIVREDSAAFSFLCLRHVRHERLLQRWDALAGGRSLAACCEKRL